MTKFCEGFSNIEDIIKEFEITMENLEGCEILYAAYETGMCDGSALVLFKKNDELFVVEASHCSCYGLEGQWDPVLTNEVVLKKEVNSKTRHFYDDFQTFIDFCNEYFQLDR